MTKLPLRDFYFRSTCQISAHSDTVEKNDEITPDAVFVPDQPVKFELNPTPSRKMTKLQIFRFLSTCQILAYSDTVPKNDEIAPGAVFVSDQPVKF